MMSSNTSNSMSTSSKPSTNPEAARTAAQTDHCHHSIPIPDEVKHAQGTNQLHHPNKSLIDQLINQDISIGSDFESISHLIDKSLEKLLPAPTFLNCSFI